MPNPFLPLALVALALAPQDSPPAQDDELAVQLYRQQSALAGWRLRATVDDEVSELVTAVADLEQAAGQLALGAPRNAEVIAHLAEVNAAHLRLLVERGMLAAAVEQYGDLRALAASKAEYPGRALTDAARAALSADGMDAVLARIPLAVQEAAEDPGTRSSEEVVIASAVRRAVQMGEEQTVRKLGARALPTLREMALQMGPTPAAGTAEAALQYLVAIDRPAGLDLALEIARRPSFLVRKRLVDVLRSENAFQADSVWTPTEPGTWALARPEWLEIFELVTAEPGVALEELEQIVGYCLYRGFVPPVIERFAATIGVRALPGVSRPSPALAPLAERLLADPRVDVRKWAARTLYHMPDAEAMTAVARLAGDPSPEIRRLVLDTLQKRRLHVWLGHERGDAGFATIELAPEANETTGGALATLLSDESEGLSLYAVQVLETLARSEVELFSVEELRELAASVSHSPGRGRVLGLALDRGSDEQDVETIERALSDPEPSVRALAFYWTTNGGFARHAPDLYWATIERTRGLEAFSAGRALSAAIQNALNDPSWTDATLDWLGRHGSDEDWGSAGYGDSSRRIPTAWAATLADASRVRLLRGLAPRFPDRTLRIDLWERQEDAAPWRAAVLDDGAAPLVRVLAAEPAITPDTADPALVRAISDALLGAAADDGIDGRWLANVTNRLSQRLAYSGIEHLALELALVEAEDVRVDFRPHIEPDVVAATPERQRAFLRAFVRRYEPSTWSSLRNARLLPRAVWAARHLPFDEQVPVLEAAARADFSARDAAFSVIAESRDPRLLEVLRDHVRSGERDGLQPLAQAAAGFLSDEAAEVILEAAAVENDAETRAAILASLDQITAYQDARARWQRRSDAAARRVDAIAALVELADDPAQPVEVRAEALRGLALLDAVEELPRLVRALADPEGPIRDAARAALARLNAAPGNEAGGDDE